jgi:uncharacterized SAM-binding protein YcdF (DUF218 family)
MKSRVYFFGFFMTIIILYMGGCKRAGNWLVKEDVPAHADAMVILMGNFPDRVLQAVDLYHDGMVGKLLIVEENMGPFRALEARGADIITNTEQARKTAVALGIPADSITILPGDARSTLDEALVIRNYLSHKTTVDTLLLVSSAPHMRRASMIFRATLHGISPPIYIGCRPSRYSSFRPEKWWCRKEDIQTVLSEYVKILSFVLVEKRQIRQTV